MQWGQEKGKEIQNRQPHRVESMIGQLISSCLPAAGDETKDTRVQKFKDGQVKSQSQLLFWGS